MSDLEELLGQHIKLSGLPVPAREYRFHPRRRWRFDFAWPRYKVAVEIDGGIYNRGRHVRGSGFERDAEKRNAAVMAGWRVLHFTPRHVKSGSAVQAIEYLIRKIGPRPDRGSVMNRKKQFEESRPKQDAGGIVRLDKAVICIDCNCITETERNCRVCGSASVLSLATILDRKAVA